MMLPALLMLALTALPYSTEPELLLESEQELVE
jgi:hypothetical protein